MKKLLISLVLFFSVLAVVFAGAGREQGASAALLISSFDDTFMQYVMDAAEEKATELGLNLKLLDGKEDSQVQLEQIENLVTQEVDAIIIHAVNSEATDPMTQLILDSGIHLVYVNRYPSSLPAPAVYVGSDDYDAGLQQGNYIVDMLGGSGSAAILEGAPGSAPAIYRTKAVEDVFAKTNITITRKLPANFRRPDAVSIVENWISSGDIPDAILANNDEMAIGAVIALEEAGVKDQVIVAGVDATPIALEYIEQGKLEATVFQNAAGQGAGSVEAAYKLIMGESVDQEVWIPFELVTPDNYQSYK